MKWLAKIVYKLWEHGSTFDYPPEIKMKEKPYRFDEFPNPLNITIYNAVGGRIVKFWTYDRQTDENSETVYIINNDENFEESLSKFIALETLKHVG